MSRALDAAQEDYKPDMTPMIDVVFLLIIFFLCIDFRILEAKLPAFLPKDAGNSPTEQEPLEKLILKIVCESWGTPHLRVPGEERRFDTQVNRWIEPAKRLEGHSIYWELGPKRIRDLAELVRELKKVADDPSKRQPDKAKPGEMKLMAVVIEPGKETTYGDVATTVDAVTNAGFTEINFGGGLGARDQGTPPPK
jgi:biopolymer transport protein ExbD